VTCNREKTVTLETGKQVCNYCPGYLIECEARELLNMTLAQRQLALARREKQRGDVTELKMVMTEIFKKRKGNLNN
jgi:hypothetical protein